MGKTKILPEDFEEWVKGERGAVDELEFRPGIIILKLNEQDSYMERSLEEVLTIMDDPGVKFAGKHCIDYVGKYKDSIGIYFQDGKDDIDPIKEGVLKELTQRLRTNLNFEKIGTACYKGEDDNVGAMIRRAYENEQYR